MSSTEEDTFNRLRRVPYNEACAIYTIACWHLPSNSPSEELHNASKEALRIAGWTIEELNEEGKKFHDEIITDIKALYDKD